MATGQAIPIEHFQAFLGGLITTGKIREQLVKIGEHSIVADTKRNFLSASGPDGDAWDPIGHLAKRSRRGGSSRPLMDNRTLSGSLFTAHGKGSVYRLTNDTLVVGTNVIHARIHQEGGVIKAKPGKKLSIPIHPKARGISARNYPGELELLKSRRGNLFLADKAALEKVKGKDLRSALRYLLLSKVKVPARPFMGFGKRLADKLQNLFEAWIEREFRSSGGGGV